MGKLEELRKWFIDKEKVIIAFSGGVDSSLLLKVGYQVLGDNIIAVTAASPLNTPEETLTAKKVALEIGIKEHLIIELNDLDNPLVESNPPDRCYHCKKARFERMLSFAQEKGVKHVVDGSNADDLADYRPGLIAVQELGIYSPLQEIGMTKEEIRVLARDLELSVWDKPSEPCLATRFPAYTPLSKENLWRVYRGEKFLKSHLKVRQVRLRDHSRLGRIEVEEADLFKVIENKEKITAELMSLGYTYITVDLLGYRTGSMNIGRGE